MFLMSVWQVYAEFRFIFLMRSRKKFTETETDESVPFVFVILQKHTVNVHKRRSFTVSNDVSYLKSILVLSAVMNEKSK